MIEIKENIKLAQFTTFKVGGLAKFFVDCKNEDEILESLRYAKKNNLNFFILGGGSNIVISDKGFDGLVIKLENNNIKIDGDVLECSAGVVLFDAVKYCAKNELTGLEWAAGIPGAFGGAVRGNAGAFWGDMSKNIQSVRAIDLDDPNFGFKELSNKECEFEYRTSIFKKQKNLVIVSAKMKFEKGDREKSLTEISDIIKKRVTKQPQGFPSAGSFFQNPVVENNEIISKFERDIGSKSRGGKVAAGWLIENAGIRGKKIGGAMISEQHANFLVNAGGAKADDIIMLSSYVKQQVRDKMGVQLFEEVQYVGFD